MGTFRGAFAAAASSRGSVRPPDDRGYGHGENTYWEDGSAVYEGVHFFRGHEILVIEKLSFTESGKSIKYSMSVQGPKGDAIKYVKNFEV